MTTDNGDVKLKVALETQKAEKQAGELGNSLSKALSSSASRASKTANTIVQQIVKANSEMQKHLSLQKEASQVRPTKAYQDMVDQLKKLQTEYDKTRVKADSLEMKVSKAKDTETRSIYASQLDTSNRAAEELHNKITSLKDAMISLEASGKHMDISPTYYQEAQAVQVLQDKIRLLIASLEEETGETYNTSSANQEFTASVERTELPLTRLARKISEVFGGGKFFGEPTVAKDVEEIGEQADRSAERLQRLKRVASGIKSIFSRIGKSSANAFNNISLKKGFSTVLKYTFGVHSLYLLFRKLGQAAGDSLKEMSKQVPEVNRSLSTMSTAFNGLKASLGTAFQPLLSAISSMIVNIINKVTQLANAIAGLFGRLTGQNYIYKATAAQVDYAKSLDKSGKSAKKLNKQLAGFDELNNLTSQDKSDSGAGATPTATYTKADIPDNIKNMADWLKSMWEDADFTELGAKIGQKLKDALDKIPWEDIQAKGRKIGKSFATLLNGFFEVPDFGKSVGHAIAEGFNTVVYTVQSFVNNLHWASIGQFFADMVNSFFKDFDWAALGNTISNFVSGILDLLIQFVSETDWELVGEKIIEFISSIDWIRVLAELSTLAGSLLVGALELLWGLFAEVFDNIGDLFEEMGLDSIAGFFKGMADNLHTSVQVVKEWFSTYIVKPIKDFFGIHSPSTLFAEIGTNLILGLINGVKSIIGTVAGIFTSAWNSIKTATVTAFNTIKSTIVSIVQSIWTAISNVLSTISSKWNTAWNSMKTGVISIFNSIKSSVISIFSGLWNGIRGTINSILSGIQSMANNVVGGINTLIRAMNSIPKINLNIPTVGQITIPHLAKGAVIPPNKEFMAVLGDQKQGTNIEAPLDTIKQAMAETIANMGAIGGDNRDIVVQIDGYEVFRAVRKQNNIFTKSTGASAFA